MEFGGKTKTSDIYESYDRVFVMPQPYAPEFN